MKLFDLSGKVALVTGGTRGIGFGIAEGLAQAGANIAICARNADAGEKASAQLLRYGSEVFFVPADVADESSCRNMIGEVVTRFGQLDIVVNNAGFNIRKTPDEMTVSEFRQVLDTNLVGPFTCSQAAHSHMKESGGGKIINVSSIAAHNAGARQTAYAPSKSGLVQLTRVQASAWAKDNIRVNAILPGWVDTEMTGKNSQTIPGFSERVAARTPLGRWGKPSDFAALAIYLASDASSFMTGSAIILDGGYIFSS